MGHQPGEETSCYKSFEGTVGGEGEQADAAGAESGQGTGVSARPRPGSATWRDFAARAPDEGVCGVAYNNLTQATHPRAS